MSKQPLRYLWAFDHASVQAKLWLEDGEARSKFAQLLGFSSRKVQFWNRLARIPATTQQPSRGGAQQTEFASPCLPTDVLRIVVQKVFSSGKPLFGFEAPLEEWRAASNLLRVCREMHALLDEVALQRLLWRPLLPQDQDVSALRDREEFTCFASCFSLARAASCSAQSFREKARLKAGKACALCRLREGHWRFDGRFRTCRECVRHDALTKRHAHVGLPMFGVNQILSRQREKGRLGHGAIKWCHNALYRIRVEYSKTGWVSFADILQVMDEMPCRFWADQNSIPLLQKQVCDSIVTLVLVEPKPHFVTFWHS